MTSLGGTPWSQGRLVMGTPRAPKGKSGRSLQIAASHETLAQDNDFDARVGIAWFVVTGLIAAGACSGDQGGDNRANCPQGAERCPCYSNHTCNAGLTCSSDVCERGAGGSSGTGTGDASSSGGNSTTGGGMAGTENQDSGAAKSSGTAGLGGGAGADGFGGNAAGSGGNGVAGGDSGMCSNTQTDPQNCGQCGRVCDSAKPIFGGCPVGGCCQSGKCAPAFGACITQGSGFVSCAAFCVSIGETCAQGGCNNGRTWLSWGLNSQRCESFQLSNGASSHACDTQLPWDDSTGKVRCCCSDTK
jgi:hypothetical protein